MTLHVNDGGTWRTIQGVYVNDGGTWREIQEIYVNDAGTWRSVYQGITIGLTDVLVQDDPFDPSDAFAAYELQPDGDIQTYTGVSNADFGDWITPKSSASGAFACRATLQSGNTPSGTLNTWLTLDNFRSWSLTRTTAGTNSCQLLIEIRRESDGVVLGSATISLVAQVQS